MKDKSASGEDYKMLMAFFMTFLGILGAGLCVLAYALLGMGKIDSKNIWYFVMNGLGGLFLFASIAYDFDFGDTGGLVVEACWVVISILGIAKVLRNKKSTL